MWYGKGGHWINLGLTMYVTMDRNPENGAEIHNSACSQSGIMIQPIIVKSARNEEEQEDDKENIPHGTKVLKGLVIIWDHTYKIVCAESYFASVTAEEELRKHVIFFIGVIKTAMRKFLMTYLSNIEFKNWGYISGLLTRMVDRTNPVLGAFVWMDRKR